MLTEKNKICSMYIIEYYTAMRINELELHISTWKTKTSKI